MDAAMARKTWRSLEAVHGMIYFTPDAPPAYAAIGISSPRAGYFLSRSAAMGAVPAEVVIATFYNFHPGLVRRAMHGGWATATPEAVTAARLDAVDTSLRRAFGAELLGSAELARAAELTRRAALTACEHPEGRPLLAGHASLSWPGEPHLALWHAQTLLREFRGDGHVAALALAGLSGLDALLSHAASGEVPAEVLRLSRSWSEDEWATGLASLATRGVVDGTGAFTDAGRAQRQQIEDATDRAALVAYEALTDDEAAELISIGRTLTKQVLAAGLLQVDPARFDDA
ncbi:MAG: hypothetical protein QM733_23420 [Ilumatobacteraceae bacterium]